MTLGEGDDDGNDYDGNCDRKKSSIT